jgi:putative transposase
MSDGLFHVTTRGGRRGDIFVDDVDRRAFLSLLGRVVSHHRWKCHAFCLMTTHYHLVVEATADDLSRGMQRLNGGYARRFNERHGTGGHLFGGRYRALAIESEEHLDAAREYVLANPVRAGLCRSVDDWPWSGCPELASSGS